MIRAAGGVVLDGDQVLVVHRPRHDDWSLPKGKLEDGEDDATAAVREVREETGVIAALGPELAATHYTTPTGKDKRVRWWTMHTRAQAPRDADDEVDEVRWLPLADVDTVLSYATDRRVVREALAATGHAAVLVVRHAEAGDRAAWNTDDRHRPLTAPGHDQADALVRRLTPWHVTRLVTSPLARCTQTLAPLAAARGLAVAADDRLVEGTGRGDVLALLAEAASGTVLCSHGDVIGDLVHGLQRDGLVPRGARWDKGSVWVLTLDGDRRVTAADYLPPHEPSRPRA